MSSREEMRELMARLARGHNESQVAKFERMEAERSEEFARVSNEKVAELRGSEKMAAIHRNHLLSWCDDFLGEDIREATLERYKKCEQDYEWEYPDPDHEFMQDFAWFVACTEELVKRGELPKLNGLLDG